MFRRKNKPAVIEPLELELKVLEFRQALLDNPSTLGAEDFLATQPSNLREPLKLGLRHLFSETAPELRAEGETQAVGFYLLSIYAD